jgi:tetratricopeptide (TPR) repeat protein
VAAVPRPSLRGRGRGRPRRHYLELAGDHADQVFANEEAIASYRQALAVMTGDRVANSAVSLGAASERQVAAARLWEKLTDLLMFIDRFEEARSAAHAGLAIVGPEDRLQAAKLQYLLGKIEFQQAHFDSALAAFAAAEGLIGAPGLDDDQEWVELWLVLQLNEQFYIYDERKEVERCAALIEGARRLMEARGSAEVVMMFYGALTTQHLRERRYRVDEQILEEVRRHADAASAPELGTLSLCRPGLPGATNGRERHSRSVPRRSSSGPGTRSSTRTASLFGRLPARTWAPGKPGKLSPQRGACSTRR